MKAGLLRHRISCYQQNLAPDGCGGFEEEFSLRGNCWAKVSPAEFPSNEEQYHDRSIVMVKGIKIRTRNNIGFVFQPTDIIIFRDLLFRIQAISDIDFRGFKYELYCFEIERDTVKFGSIGGLFTQEGLKVYNQEGLIVYDQSGVA